MSTSNTQNTQPDKDALLQSIVTTLTEQEQLQLGIELIARAYLKMGHGPSLLKTTPSSVQSTSDSSAQRPSWRAMVGLAEVPGKEPPTDEEVARWLGERGMEK
jgi:hypothetical protein